MINYWKRLRGANLGKREFPWWALVLVVFFIFAGVQVLRSDQYRDILSSMMDSPQWSTENKYNAVYEVSTPVQVVSETVSVRLPDDSRVTVDATAVESREEGRLLCDREADPECLDQEGMLVTFRVPVNAGEAFDGTVEQIGLLRPFGNIVDLPDGNIIIIEEANILTREENGTLPCNRIVDPVCEDRTGTVITFEMPYRLQTGLLARDDIRIRHSDGYEEVVRPNRLANLERATCEGESETCHLGVSVVADFRERITGTEVERTDTTIRVRTVDEQREVIPVERILNQEEGTIACNREANPRCQDFEGVTLAREGEVIEGRLTLESNRSLDIIPEGEVTALEVLKTDIAEEIRTPEGCTPTDADPCQITIKKQDDTVAGVILEENAQEITIQTVAPVFIEVERDSAVVVRRSPAVCAVDNLRGCNAGIWLTLLVTFISYGLALIIGLLVGLMRVSSNKFIYHASTLYVELVRGTPLLVLLLFFAFVIGPTIRDTDKIVLASDLDITVLGQEITEISIPIGKVTQPIYSFLNRIEVAILGEESFLAEAVLGLAIGYGAFLAEVFRAGIQSIGRGQMEAARSLGMSYPQAMRLVILPQAARIMLPPLGNDFIAMLKDSALISVLALPDMLQMGRLYITRTFQPIPVYVVIALLYVLLTLFLSFMVRTMERRFRIP